VLNHLIGDDRPGAVAHDLMDVDDDASRLDGGEAPRLDVGIDHVPLAGPVGTHGVVAVHVAALHPVRPHHVRMHRAQRGVDVAGVERRVRIAE